MKVADQTSVSSPKSACAFLSHRKIWENFFILTGPACRAKCEMAGLCPEAKCRGFFSPVIEGGAIGSQSFLRDNLKDLLRFS
jgi:hypothetical protein